MSTYIFNTINYLFINYFTSNHIKLEKINKSLNDIVVDIGQRKGMRKDRFEKN